MEREGCNADQIQLAREVLHSLKNESDSWLGVKQRERRHKLEPWWKRRNGNQIAQLRKGVSRLEKLRSGELYNIAVCEGLEQRYYLKKKGVAVVLEELKQRILAKTCKIKRYQSRIEQYWQNKMFQSNQKRLFEMLGNEERDNSVVPDIEESMRFWSSIWDNPVSHNTGAEWLKDVETSLLEYRNRMISR